MQLGGRVPSNFYIACLSNMDAKYIKDVFFFINYRIFHFFFVPLQRN
jgi:hypothetical protein